MKRYLFIIAVVCSLIFSFNIMSEEFKHKDAGIKMSVPKGWKVKTDEDDLEITSPDDLVMMFFSVIEPKDIDAAVKELDKELGKLMKKVQSGKIKESKVNGMKLYELEGSGYIEGLKVDWGIYIVNAKKPVFIISIFLPGWKKWGKTLDAFGESIKPLGSIKNTGKTKIPLPPPIKLVD